MRLRFSKGNGGIRNLESAHMYSESIFYVGFLILPKSFDNIILVTSNSLKMKMVAIGLLFQPERIRMDQESNLRIVITKLMNCEDHNKKNVNF